jgi:metal-responsive CopG/Arc/MetJ family transcriptional regulator
MANVKTAISLRKSLFEQADALARKMKIPRSRLFALALADYLARQENRELLERINAAYSDAPDPSEQTLLRKARRLHRRLVEGEW